jgi:hypothetical protein
MESSGQEKGDAAVYRVGCALLPKKASMKCIKACLWLRSLLLSPLRLHPYRSSTRVHEIAEAPGLGTAAAAAKQRRCRRCCVCARARRCPLLLGSGRAASRPSAHIPASTPPRTRQAKRYLTPTMLQTAAAAGLELTLIDAAVPIEEQGGPFDAILHKLRPDEGEADFFALLPLTAATIATAACGAALIFIQLLYEAPQFMPAFPTPAPTPTLLAPLPKQPTMRPPTRSLGDLPAPLPRAAPVDARDRPAGVRADAAEPIHDAVAAAGGRRHHD